MEIRSLAKGLSVIEALASSPSPLTAVQLSRQLKLTRPTLYRILGTLAEHEFVTREEASAFYRLTFKLLDIGQRVLEQTDLLDAARPVLRKLGTRCRETVHLAVPEGGWMVYLDKLDGAGPFCTYSRPGGRVPMHCTALGKAVLAHLSANRVRAILVQRGLSRHTVRTIVTVPAMERELARVQRLGYAMDDVEFEEGVRCVGAPVFDYRGIPIAAISVSAPVSRMPLARAHEVGALLRETVGQVSRAMGWRPTPAVLPRKAAPAQRPQAKGRIAATPSGRKREA